MSKEHTYVVSFTDTRELGVEITAGSHDEAIAIVRWIWRNKHLTTMHDHFSVNKRDDFANPIAEVLL